MNRIKSATVISDLLGASEQTITHMRLYVYFVPPRQMELENDS